MVELVAGLKGYKLQLIIKMEDCSVGQCASFLDIC